MKPPKGFKKCSVCGKVFKMYRTTAKWCSVDCAYQDKKNQGIIPKKSKKRIAQEKIYTELRRVFLNKSKNRYCPITGEITTEIHHKKGRIGELLNDTRYWIALSRNGHKKVEENPEWAKEKGYSLSRLEND